MGKCPYNSNNRRCLKTPSSKSLFCCLLFVLMSISGFESSELPTPPPDPEKEIEIAHKIQDGHAILSCIVKDLGSRRIIWSRLADPYPISVGTLRFHPNQNKYRVINRVNTNALTIRNVGLEDSGEYQCRVSGSFPLKEVISLNIQSPGPKSTFFHPTNRTVISAVGLTVTLPCKVENLNGKMVMWKDGRNTVISLRKRVYNGDKRLRVIHDKRPEWHLKIEKLKEDDFGFYTCLVNSDPVLTRTIELINNEPPKIAPVLKRDTNFRKKIEAMAGDSVTLVCNFHAYPPATVKWYKRYLVNNRTRKRDLGATGNEYTLRSVNLQQAGDYICIAKNGMGQEGKARTRLIVKMPPTTAPTTVATTTFIPNGPTFPHVYYEQQRVGQRRGRDVELTCFAIGQPKPSIHWRRHGARITDDHKYKVISKSIGRFRVHSTLLIRVVSSRDLGTYQCTGYNQLGLKHIPIELYEAKS